MKKLNSTVALAALAAVMSTPAFAADVEVAAPVTEDWTGFYVGAGGGGNFAFAKDRASASFSSTTFFSDTFDASGESFSDLGKAGSFGTVEAGADYQMNNFVFGVLANYDFGKTEMNTKSSASISSCTSSFCSTSDGHFRSSVEVGDSWAIGARIGILATDRTLLYALGGYTQAKIDQSVKLSDDSGFSFGDSSSDWEPGYFIGAGAEVLFTDHISLKGEYRFSDYGNVKNNSSFSTSSSGSISSGNTHHSSDVTVHSVRATLDFRF